MFKDRLHELEISFPPRYGAVLHLTQHTTDVYNIMLLSDSLLLSDVSAVVSRPGLFFVFFSSFTGY